ncbi:EF-hand domain-containing protein [uncultured Sphingomonas sp.]|uniref:EF-hand domain-containing protein n=1 Tax=uncultured Sphingomonas sp. TaxID=158754 RepID=UPI0025FB6D5D|nr:EF-hand domain-containing protein [uncultured Sphingomonas sp.]
MKTRYGAASAAFALLLPAMACGQAMPPAVHDNGAAARPRSGLTLQDFTSRRERRVLAADTDGDGKVSRAEYLAAATRGKGDPARRFARLDRNGDGVVDRQEIASLLARRFARLDTDHDGVLTPTERSAARPSARRAAPEA